MCLDIHPDYPNMIAIGLYDGNVAVSLPGNSDDGNEKRTLWDVINLISDVLNIWYPLDIIQSRTTYQRCTTWSRFFFKYLLINILYFIFYILYFIFHISYNYSHCAGKGWRLGGEAQKGCLGVARGHVHHVILHPRVIFEPTHVCFYIRVMGVAVKWGDFDTENGDVWNLLHKWDR